MPELKNSPAPDRITKGYQVVMNRDWPVASRAVRKRCSVIPTTVTLKRSVDLAQWMVDHRQAAGPVTPIYAAISTASCGDAFRDADFFAVGLPTGEQRPSQLPSSKSAKTK